MANKFKKGDVVVLRSGGPAMTIDGVGKGLDNGYSVVWFDSNEEIQFMEFDEEVLEMYDEDEDFEE